MLDTIQTTITEIDNLENRAMRLRSSITELLTPILNIIWPEGWSDEFTSAGRRIEEYSIGENDLYITFSYSDGERGHQMIPLSILRAADPAQAMREHLAVRDKLAREAREAEGRVQYERLAAKFGKG